MLSITSKFRINVRRRIYIFKSAIRRDKLKKEGLKEFRIISISDKKISKEELLKIKEDAFNKLLKENYQWYIYDIDKGEKIFGF